MLGSGFFVVATRYSAQIQDGYSCAEGHRILGVMFSRDPGSRLDQHLICSDCLKQNPKLAFLAQVFGAIVEYSDRTQNPGGAPEGFRADPRGEPADRFIFIFHFGLPIVGIDIF